MKTILYYTFPVSGHINPVLKLLESLAKGDYNVICYSTVQYKNVIENTGAVFRDYNEDSECINLNVPPEKMTLLTLSGIIVSFITKIFPKLLSDAKGYSPDCVGLDFFCIWGKMIAEGLKVKSFTTIPQFAPHPKKFKPFPGMMKHLIQIVFSGQKTMSQFRKLIRAINSEVAVGKFRFFDIFMNYSKLNIVYVNKELQPDYETFDNSFVFTGPSLRTTDSNGNDEITFDRCYDGKLIYISLGTLYNQNLSFYLNCIRIFKNTKHKIIISVGKSINIKELGSIPENIAIRNQVDQLQVLSKADLFITHGGMNSVNEALYHKVKMIVIPQAVDQYATAQQLSNLQLAVYYRRKAIDDKLLSVIEELINNADLEKKLADVSSKMNTNMLNVDFKNIIDRYICSSLPG